MHVIVTALFLGVILRSLYSLTCRAYSVNSANEAVLTELLKRRKSIREEEKEELLCAAMHTSAKTLHVTIASGWHVTPLGVTKKSFQEVSVL